MRAAAPAPLVATAPVSWRFMLPYTLATLAMWMAFNAPGQVLIGEQLITLDEANKEANLALILGVGALISLLANPLFGALSDHARGRLGRRRPYLIGGAVAATAGLLLLGVGGSVPVLVAGWGLTQLALNAYQAALTAVIPDRVLPSQRATVSGLAGLSQVLGTILGVGLTGLLPIMLARYALLGALLLLAMLGFVLTSRDPQAPTTPPAPLSLAGFLSPLRHRDFALAWLTRGLVTLGYALGTTYLLYFLRDRVGLKDPAAGVFQANLAAGGALLLTVLLGGVLSDRLGRRKVFVIGSTVVIAAGLLTLALLPTWPGTLAAAALMGAGFGVYLAVDGALITEVLPSAHDSARDLGVINVALTLPQTFAPALCALFVTSLGGYTPLFLVAAVITLISAALVQGIRGVR